MPRRRETGEERGAAAAGAAPGPTGVAAAGDRGEGPGQHFGGTAASPASSSGEHTGRGILRGGSCWSSCVLPPWGQVGILFGEEAVEGTGCAWELQCMCETQLTALIRRRMSQAWETAFLQTAAGKSPISSSSHAALAHPTRGRPSCRSLP